MKRHRLILMSLCQLILAMNLLAQEEPTYNGELNVTLNGIGDISVQAVTMIWGKHSDGFPITTSFSGKSVSNMGGLTFDNCDHWNTNPDAVAYALYRIRVTYSGTTHTIYVDWRDCDYATETDYVDIDVRVDFNVYTSAWNVNGSSVSEGSTVAVWDATVGIKSSHTQNTAGFEPTDPTDLSVSTSGNPALNWTRSEPRNSAKYIVYRNSTAITSTAISDSFYVDTEYSIFRTGSDLEYKVRAVSGDGTKYSSGYSNTVNTKAIPTEKLADKSAQVVPASRELVGAYPNPFNPQTTIRFTLPADTHTHLSVYDLLGRETVRLVDGDLKAGAHEAVWKAVDAQGRPVPSGMYLYRIQSAGGTRQGKMLLVS